MTLREQELLSEALDDMSSKERQLFSKLSEYEVEDIVSYHAEQEHPSVSFLIESFLNCR